MISSDVVEAAGETAPEQTLDELPVEEAAAARPKTHKRAGYTTNKGHGQPKARRKMAAKSRRVNRSK